MCGKQCRPRSDAAFCGVWSGSTLFAYAFVHLFLWLNFANQIKVHHNFEWCLLRWLSLSIWLFWRKLCSWRRKQWKNRQRNLITSLAPPCEFYISNLTKVKYSSFTIFLHISSPLPVRISYLISQIRENDIPKLTGFLCSIEEVLSYRVREPVKFQKIVFCLKYKSFLCWLICQLDGSQSTS